MVVEVETAKAAVELPIPWAGVVTALHVEPGVTIPVGTALLTVDVTVSGETSSPLDVPPKRGRCCRRTSPSGEACAGATAAAAPETVGARPEADLVPSGPPPQARREAVLVGYGVREAAVTRRPRRRPPAGPAPAAGAPADRPVSRGRAKPPVRKLAKDLGVDLADLTPTGPDGTITRDDVLAGRQRVRRLGRSGARFV